DRDDNEIQEVISQFSEIFSRLFWSLALENNSRNIFEYTVDEIKYNFTITPIIIPFEAKGTIETLLMDAMAENSAEDNMVVESAQSYIERLISARNLKKYLQHQRLIPKAKFSTVLSVINPEKSTDTMNTILIQYDWESKAEIRRHFRLLEYL
ncbi:MAG TPA: hypothetical protein PK467_15055, partial [Candidatus Wallbacteria bacterium]|nr:hypothetical protein [Candidatus Wallbacteria bacterium]